MLLSRLDGKRIAVVLDGSAKQTVVRGLGTFEVDEDLGNCLRVALTGQPGNPSLFFQESGDVRFEVDRLHGCDFAVALDLKGALDVQDTFNVQGTESAQAPALSRKRSRQFVG